MDLLKAVNVKKPKRTTSVPARLSQVVCRRSLPCSVVDALFAARGRLESYRTTSLKGTGTRHSVEMISRAIQTGDNNGTTHDLKEGKQQEQQSSPVATLASTLPNTRLLSDNKRDDCSVLTEHTLGGTMNGDMSSGTSVFKNASPTTGVTTSNTTTTTTCIPYDPKLTRLAMTEYKRLVDRCPEKVAIFLKQLSETIANKAPEALPPSHITVSRSKASSSTHHTNRAPEALKEWWETRREAPISVTTALGRKRGLFGDLEKKELHRHVISILNRVTDDAEKFREVKNELLRLPIPEANDGMLTKIVEVFFTKAVRERQFSSLYADLVSALCKVPEGQRIVGDKAQSLEYRLRQRLLHLCQEEFRKLEERNIESAEQGGEDRVSQSAEEGFKERRDKVCGIVLFIGELFLRHIVTEKVIEDIFMTACTGPYRHEGLHLPPLYTPTEAQMDETIALLGVVDSAFFQTPLGSSMLLDFSNVMQHWVVHYPVPRIRFLLLSVVERLQKLVKESNGAGAVSHPQPQKQKQQQQQQQQQQHKNTDEQQQSQPSSLQDRKRELNNSGIALPSSPCSEEGFFSSSGGKNTMAAPNNMSPKLRHSVYVGGKPIPAPRSAASRQGSITLSVSVNSNSSSATQVTKQVATAENVAQYMQNVSLSGSKVEDVVEEIMNSFANVIFVVEVWTDRCLGVVKAVKERSSYGIFLCSLNRYHKGSLKQELRKIAMNAFVNAVRQKLHEDLGIFKYWAAMIWSDVGREVLDEDLLNEALHYLLGNDSAAVQMYLCDVAKQLQIMSTNPRPPSEEANNFVRYRPLCVVRRFNTRREPGYELRTVNFANVRQVSLEIHIFCALLTGKPTKEALFDTVRLSHLRSLLVVPDVLSAILHAELCNNTTAYLEDNLDLLNLVVDGPERETREMLLITEVYATLKDAPEELTSSLSAGSRVLMKLGDHFISDETRQRAQKYFEARDKFAHHYIDAQIAQVPSRQGIMDNVIDGVNVNCAGSVNHRSAVQRK